MSGFMQKLMSYTCHHCSQINYLSFYNKKYLSWSLRVRLTRIQPPRIIRIFIRLRIFFPGYCPNDKVEVRILPNKVTDTNYLSSFNDKNCCKKTKIFISTLVNEYWKKKFNYYKYQAPLRHGFSYGMRIRRKYPDSEIFDILIFFSVFVYRYLLFKYTLLLIKFDYKIINSIKKKKQPVH